MARVILILLRLPIKANILIDQSGCARLADFGLLTIISDPKYLLSSSSHTQGGTVRWMSPERIAPNRFGFKDGRPTIPSDCYALAMVVYETITGNLPFHKDADLTVFMKIVEGERPPRGAKFTDSLWGMLGQCWTPGPTDRPSIEAVLQCLETVSSFPEPSSPGVGGEMDEDDAYSDSTTNSSGTPNWTSDAVITEGIAATSSGLSYLAGPPIPTSTAPEEEIGATSYLLPSSYYKIRNVEGISGGHFTNPEDSRGRSRALSFTDSITQRVVGSRFQEFETDSGTYGRLPMGSPIHINETTDTDYPISRNVSSDGSTH